MKLLRVRASNYKNCCDEFTIDLVAKSKKTSEDKEYELQEIAEDLYVFNTVSFVGKNASGKTSAIELMECSYSILSEFRLEDKHYNYDNVKLEIIFYHEDFIYKYNTVLKADPNLGSKANFTEQHIYKKKYYKSKVKDIYSDEGFEKIGDLGELPEDTSIVFFVLKKKSTRAVYFNCDGESADTYRLMFRAMKTYKIPKEVLTKVIKIFDDKIQSLEMMDEKHYKLTCQDCVKELSDSELVYMLSSGTAKGVLLYIFVVAALENGFDLLIDEVENHFHKTLVENMISLFKDKTVNKKSATLIFTTHYCEVLDLFNRQDNIWIAKSDNKIRLDNMYETYNIRPELLKSRQFYNNAFDTSVNYEDPHGIEEGADEMKYLIMCEGPNELEIIRMLLEYDKLIFTEDDLLNLVPYHARQIASNPTVKAALNLYHGDVQVLRIGDKLNDELKIPKEYKGKIKCVEKYLYQTELEMLLIIFEGMTADFEKEKSKKSPKSFSKENVVYNRTRYDNSTAFYREYYGDRIDLLVDTIKRYKQLKGKHQRDELYLADLLK